jgi:hypothetical protein
VLERANKNEVRVCILRVYLYLVTLILLYVIWALPDFHCVIKFPSPWALLLRALLLVNNKHCKWFLKCSVCVFLSLCMYVNQQVPVCHHLLFACSRLIMQSLYLRSLEKTFEAHTLFHVPCVYFLYFHAACTNVLVSYVSYCISLKSLYLELGLKLHPKIKFMPNTKKRETKTSKKALG